MSDEKTFDRDSISNTLTIAVGLSLICSVLVASAAIVLKPKQLKNQEEYRQRIILDVAGLMEPNGDIASLFATIQADTVDIASGESVEIYLEMNGDATQQIILPISGPGLWSTMRGYLAIAPDGNTVKGIRFYEHAETPGLGDQIDRADWRNLWVGKQLYGGDSTPRIEVVRGFALRDSTNTNLQHQIDGLSGATLTGNGVSRLVRHWIGPEGFGPYLETFR
jgi:Na+-transporting NADH:ubiquinone oxidoreductase subunit C